MLSNFIIPSTNLIHLSLTGSTREEILKDLLDKLIEENLKNLSVINEGTQKIYRLDGSISDQTKYRITYTTPVNLPRLDPDFVVS